MVEVDGMEDAGQGHNAKDTRDDRHADLVVAYLICYSLYNFFISHEI
jgi:hypothetical protein